MSPCRRLIWNLMVQPSNLTCNGIWCEAEYRQRWVKDTEVHFFFFSRVARQGIWCFYSMWQLRLTVCTGFLTSLLGSGAGASRERQCLLKGLHRLKFVLLVLGKKNKAGHHLCRDVFMWYVICSFQILQTQKFSQLMGPVPLS